MSFIITVDKIIAIIRGQKVSFGDVATYEKAYGNLDFTSDDDIPNIRTVKAIAGGTNYQEVSIPAGSTIPFVVDMTVNPLNTVIPAFISQVEQLDAPYDTYTKATPIYDVTVEKVYTDNTHTVLSSLNISGHPSDADATITQDDIKLILR